MNRAHARGSAGEQLALEHYQRAGYTLLERNHRSRLGELDLILEKDGLVVFCEVKTRGTGAIDSPGASVNAQKQRRLILAAGQYLQRRGAPEPFTRFDVAEVILEENGAETVNIIENAFSL